MPRLLLVLHAAACVLGLQSSAAYRRGLDPLCSVIERSAADTAAALAIRDLTASGPRASFAYGEAGFDPFGERLGMGWATGVSCGAMSIRVDTVNGVTVLEIHRPEKRNALTFAMYDALAEALNAAGADRAVRSVVLTGRPGVFTAGNDLQDFAEHPPDSSDSSVVRFMRALLSCEKPVVAAVTGTAVGIGVTLLFHCDLVYVSENARLSLPFVSLGLVPEFAVSLTLPRLIGHVQAAERLLLGEPFTGVEAVAMGIANAALPAQDVFVHARRMAARFNALPPEAVREAKRLMRQPMKAPIASAIEAENAAFYRQLRSPEAKEAFEAFLHKRATDFSQF